MEQFDIPIGIFIFKRSDKAVKIVNQIAKIAPKTLYIIGDGPRNDAEIHEIEACRTNVENAVTWRCNVIRYYADKNRGVYENIAGGAKWVFEREEVAIFLEDDNYPEITFFQYCKELLAKYKNNNKLLWICGTNYLEKYHSDDGADYSFTQLMLPCGWASWSEKFLQYYDGNLDLYADKKKLNEVKKRYKNKKLLRQNLLSWEMERKRIERGLKPISWDFQMAYTLRVFDLYGIAPHFNQIRNIGIDAFATHGTGSAKNEMVKRFCEIPTHKLNFPLKHPKTISIDPIFEKKTEKIIILPWKVRFKSSLGGAIKRFLNIPIEQKLFKRKK